MALRNNRKIRVTVPWQVHSFDQALRSLLNLVESEWRGFFSCTIDGDLDNDNNCVGRIRYGNHDAFKCVVWMVEDNDRGDYLVIGSVEAVLYFNDKDAALAWAADLEAVIGSIGAVYDDLKMELSFQITEEQVRKCDPKWSREAAKARKMMQFY